VAFKSLDASLVLVIPDFDESVVGTADEIRLVSTVIVVDTVHPFLVTVQCKIRGVGA
jgi:hypothetical protein